MGRYYNIALSGSSNTLGANPPLTLTFSSRSPSGSVDDPGALQVEFDFFSFEQHEYMGYSTLTIYGVSLADLKQGLAYAGLNITMKAGMSAGLALANPAQAGTILQGQVYQAFGNWQGTDMTLDLVVSPATQFSFTNPGNFVLNWPKNTSLVPALTQTLNLAYPTLGTPQVAISDSYVLSFDVLHSCNTLSQLARFINSLTASISQNGVRLTILPNNTILAYDGTKAIGSTIQIQFIDLVGQPTWIDPNVMQFQTVMRADVQIGSVIQMPIGLPSGPGTVILTGSSLPSSLKYQTSFQGLFQVTGIRYIGNFRDPNGQSWITVFRCVLYNAAAQGVPVVGAGN